MPYPLSPEFSLYLTYFVPALGLALVAGYAFSIRGRAPFWIGLLNAGFVAALVLGILRFAPYLLYSVPILAILLAIGYAMNARRPTPYVGGVLDSGLAAAVLLAALAFLSCGNVAFRLSNYINRYEFYHYYVGAKYDREIGYTNLYNASLIADEELGSKHLPKRVRDLNSGRVVSAASVLANRDQIKAPFTPERWRTFVDDIAFFRLHISQAQWEKQLTDKGYNASPVWTLVGGGLANLVPSTSTMGMYLLPWLDLVLLAIASAAIIWAFGVRTAAFILVLLGTHMVMSHSHMKAAFLRMDWIVALLLAACCLKRKHYAAAGALAGYAAMLRLFPLIFAAGIGSKWLHALWKKREWRNGYFNYLAAMAISMLVLFVVSAAYTGGLAYWREFLEKIVRHDEDISPWRVGFKYIFLMSYNGPAYWQQDLAVFFKAHALAWWGIQGIVIGVCLWLAPRLEDHEALAFGYVPVFFLVAPTYYYHVMLILVLLFFVPKLESPPRVIGLIYIFLTGIIAQHYYVLWDRTYPLFFLISCLFLVLVLYMAVVAFFSKADAALPSAIVTAPDTTMPANKRSRATKRKYRAKPIEIRGN